MHQIHSYVGHHGLIRVYRCMFVCFVCACVLFCSCRSGMTIALDWFVFCICCVTGWYFVSGSVLEESSEFPDRARNETHLKDSSQTNTSQASSQREFSKTSLKESYQRQFSLIHCSKRVLKDIYQSDISKKVVNKVLREISEIVSIFPFPYPPQPFYQLHVHLSLFACSIKRIGD
jgi:hypothetical protein